MPTRQPFLKYRPTSDQPTWKLRLYTVVFENDHTAAHFCRRCGEALAQRE